MTWASAPFAPLGSDLPALLDVPPMARRRIERLGRLAYHVASACQGVSVGMPAIFASRHGDVARSVELMSTLAKDETLSPTSFGLSVHNAIGGQYSITRKDPANVVSIAGGPLTPEAAMVEAWGLLREGHAEVLLVMYDVSLPSLYAGFADEPAADFAWAFRLTLPEPPSPTLGLTLDPHPRSSIGDPTLPHGLDVLRFFLRAKLPGSLAPPELVATAPGGAWVWTHHD